MHDLKQALMPYVAAFLDQAKGDGLKAVPIDGDLGAASAERQLGFKTSFGMGSSAQVPWLACLAKGQQASAEGVYPVLLYRRDSHMLAVAYGVSKTAKSTDGHWPRRWPEQITAGLSNFSHSKYDSSSVYREFPSASSADIPEIVNAFGKVISDFEALLSALPAEENSPIGPSACSGLLAACHEAGLTVVSKTSTRVLAALATKPFCILTGLAGSGKTKLAEALAMWLSESPAQYKLVAVGADWTNNEQLLGYADVLHGALYRKPANGALDLMLAAEDNPGKPHFLILDEMNLSHVERYFADVLSAMESRNAPLALHSHGGALPSVAGGVANVPPTLALPRNLFIIGTVNVDETTYMFSPKVLDRANVIEFRATAEQLSDFLDDPRRLQLDALSGGGAAHGEALVAQAAQEVELAALGDPDSAALKAALLEVFGVLANKGAEFGFRSAYEMARFVVIHKQLCGADWTLADALDAQVLQKLMPRLHGSARKLEKVLADLDVFCDKHGLPDSREKIARMQRRLQADGFASFAEN